MPPDPLAARSFGTGNSPQNKPRAKPVHWETIENLPFVAGPFHKIDERSKISIHFLPFKFQHDRLRKR